MEGFVGDVGDAMDWLAAQEPITGPTIDRDIARQVLDLARPGTCWTLPSWSADITAAWAARNEALAASMALSLAEWLHPRPVTASAPCGCRARSDGYPGGAADTGGSREVGSRNTGGRPVTGDP